MELRDAIKILAKYWKLVIGTGVVLGVLAYLISLNFPVRYRATANIYVQRVPEKSELGDYTYDGYYAGQAAEAYTDTVVGFLQSLDIAKRAAEIAGLSTEPENLLYYRKKTRVDKVAPQLVEVSTLVRGKEQAAGLVKALAQATSERATLLNQETQNKMTIDLVNSEPLVQEVRVWKELNGVLVFFVGILMSIAWIFAREYLKEV